MPTYFIRHTSILDLPPADIAQWWKRGVIAIHFPQNRNDKIKWDEPDNPSADPADYKAGSTARRAVTVFNALAREGGYVCAEYHGHTGCVIGKVKPKSRIKVQKSRWVSGKQKPKGAPALLKTLQLTEVQHLDAVQSALLLMARPQQGTLARWHKIEGRVAQLVEGQPIPLTLAGLLPAQQEVLCAEFLRLPFAVAKGLPQLQYLATAIGRTLKDVDIMGISTTGRRILAQVTYRPPTDTECQNKIKRLAKYAHPEVELLFFCQCAELMEQDGVRLVPLQWAFDALHADANFIKGISVDFWAQDSAR